MHPQTHSVIHPELLTSWLAMLGFGAYHGLNPGMGWLFALSVGLQRKSEKAIWLSLGPIALGHALSIGLVATIVSAAGHVVSLATLQLLTACFLLGFGAFKLTTYYRHPRWVGMRVGMRDLFFWSFLIAVAHGAGLMVAPVLIGLMADSGLPEITLSGGTLLVLAVCVHTGAMLAVMGFVAWIIYRKLGLRFLRKSWVNFDLIWAVALLVVGALALYSTLAGG